MLVLWAFLGTFSFLGSVYCFYKALLPDSWR